MYSKAKQALLAVQAAQQDTALWNNLLGYAEFRLNQPEDALRHLQQALNSEPANEDYLLDLGEFLIHYRAFAAAREVFEIAARRPGQSSRVQFMLAVSLILEERRPEAVELLQKVVALTPDFEPAYRALGECHEEAKDASALVGLGQKFIEREPESGTGYYLKGAGLLREAMDAGSSAARAIEALRQAVSRAPKESEWRFTLAKALHSEKQYEEAERELQETLRINPLHPRAHYILAQLYRRKGKMELARKELEVHDNLKDRDRGIRLLVESRVR
jgi:tetratricopeptide (TPR) repeat protein